MSGLFNVLFFEFLFQEHSDRALARKHVEEVSVGGVLRSAITSKVAWVPKQRAASSRGVFERLFLLVQLVALL